MTGVTHSLDHVIQGGKVDPDSLNPGQTVIAKTDCEGAIVLLNNPGISGEPLVEQ
jgi:hypothetical protein